MKDIGPQHLNNRIDQGSNTPYLNNYFWGWLSSLFALIFAITLVSGCSDNIVGSVAASTKEIVNNPIVHTQITTSTRTSTYLRIPSLTPTQTRLATKTPTAKATLTHFSSVTPTVTETPDQYEKYTIEFLTAREYGGEGGLEIEEILAENNYFFRYLVSFPSDGLEIYGFMNVPKLPHDETDERLPVVIALHGYIDPTVYNTIDYTTRYADSLAREGFLVLHPNLRGYPPSDEGDNLFRVGMAIDVLNLIAIIKDQAGKPGPLIQANPDALGLWGHSMGGGISTRVMTVSPDVKAVVLYGAMSGDDFKNFERIYSYFSNRERGLQELQAPPEVYERISPIYYLDRVQAAVSIHHGKNDQDVPIAWSLDLCNRLREIQQSIECFTYPDQLHTFHGEGDGLFIQRMIYFFDRTLRDNKQ